jgi:hypothetical protein
VSKASSKLMYFERLNHKARSVESMKDMTGSHGTAAQFQIKSKQSFEGVA